MTDQTHFRFALNFDLDEAKLKNNYPASTDTGYKRAWSDVRSFLEANGFAHAQYSGYESVEEMTYFDAYTILDNLQGQFPWFLKCSQVATLTEIGERYDVLQHLREQKVERSALPEDTLHSAAPDAPQSREDVAKSIAEAVKAKLAERKTKGTPPPDRGKKHPSR